MMNFNSRQHSRQAVTPGAGRGRATRHEVSAGGVVARRVGEGLWVVAILKTEHKRGEVWVLPKGHVELAEKETVADAALREVKEEAGISSLAIRDQLGVTRYSFQAEGALVKKTVHYFLLVTDQKRLTPQQEEGLTEAKWEPIDQAINLLAYETDKSIVERAREKLTGQRATPRRMGGRHTVSTSRRSMKIHT